MRERNKLTYGLSHVSITRSLWTYGSAAVLVESQPCATRRSLLGAGATPSLLAPSVRRVFRHAQVNSVVVSIYLWFGKASYGSNLVFDL